MFSRLQKARRSHPCDNNPPPGLVIGHTGMIEKGSTYFVQLTNKPSVDDTPGLTKAQRQRMQWRRLCYACGEAKGLAKTAKPRGAGRKRQRPVKPSVESKAHAHA